MNGQTDRRRFRSDLVHPWPLLGVLLLALNDHLLKGSGWLPGWLTGKLSDFSGLFFFPVLLTVVAESVAPRAAWISSRRVVASVSVASTGLVLAALKCSPTLASAIRPFAGTILADRTDLVALATLAPSYLYLVRHAQAPTAPWAQRLTMLAAAAASMATSAPRVRHGYALWEMTPAPPWTVGCAKLDAWVSKSGKTGMGVTLQARAEGPECVVRLEEATLSLPGRSVLRAEASLPRELTASSANDAGTYMPFVFDNEAAWNAGVTEATLRLSMRAGGPPVTHEIRLTQRYEGYHVPIDRALPVAAPSATP